MNLDQIRECMTEMMTYENASKCMNEVLQMEGFLPETIDEGDSYDNHYNAMMEDDDLCNEMFESMNSAQNECGDYIREWIDENYGGTEGVDDMENEIHTRDHAEDHMRPEEPNPGRGYMSEEGDEESDMDPEEKDEWKKGIDQDIEQFDATQGVGGSAPAGSMYVEKLHWMKEFIEDITAKMNPDQELPSWIQDMISTSFQSLEAIALHLGSEEMSGTNTPETNDVDVEIPSMSLMHSLGGEEGDEEIEPGMGEPEGMGDTEDDEESEEGDLFENELPKFQAVKGKGYDTENKKNEKETLDQMKDTEKTQKTVEQKVEDRINYKFNPDMEGEYQKEIDAKHLGAFNNLNLDFQNDVPQSYKDRVELEVTTGHSRKRDESVVGKEANVDHEATKRTGEAMIAASKANQGERDSFFKPNPIIVTDEPYEETSITGKNKGTKSKPGGGDLNENVTKQLERMKKMF